MIELGPTHPHPAAASELPPDVSARDLLRASGRELHRQSVAMAAMDAALGTVVESLIGPTRGTAAPILASSLIAELQRADHLRQDMEGLAAVLALLADLPETARIPVGTVRTCTTTLDLLTRLLATPRPVEAAPP